MVGRQVSLRGGQPLRRSPLSRRFKTNSGSKMFGGTRWNLLTLEGEDRFSLTSASASFLLTRRHTRVFHSRPNDDQIDSGDPTFPGSAPGEQSDRLPRAPASPAQPPNDRDSPAPIPKLPSTAAQPQSECPSFHWPAEKEAEPRAREEETSEDEGEETTARLLE